MSRQTFLLDPPPPFRLDLTAWTLRRRPDNVIDRWDGHSYRRVLALPNGLTSVTVTQVKPPEAPQLQVVIQGATLGAGLKATVQATVERTLGMGTDLTGFYQLALNDARLGPLAQRFRGMRPPRFVTLFEALVNGIACQQVTLTLGILLLNRLAEQFGAAVPEGESVAHAFPRPEDVAGLSPEALRPLGFSGNKAQALLELARAQVEGRLDADELASLSDADALARLCQLRGIGPWTAQYVLLRYLGRLHIFPEADSGVRRSLQRWLQPKKPFDYDAVRRILGGWAPYGGLVYFHLLLDRLAAEGCVSSSR